MSIIVCNIFAYNAFVVLMRYENVRAFSQSTMNAYNKMKYIELKEKERESERVRDGIDKRQMGTQRPTIYMNALEATGVRKAKNDRIRYYYYNLLSLPYGSLIHVSMCCVCAV